MSTKALAWLLVALVCCPTSSDAFAVNDRVRIVDAALPGTIKTVAANGNVKFQGDTDLTIGYESPNLYDPSGSTFVVGSSATISDMARVGRITAVACNGNVKFQGDTGLTIGYERPEHYETVTIPVSLPTVTLSASPSSLLSGEASTLTWSTTQATTCTATGAWAGARSTGGSETVHPTATTTYTLTCTGAGGTANQSTIISVTLAPSAPVIAMQMSVNTITSGQSAFVIWSTGYATTCTASDGWSGSQPTNGFQSVSPTTTTTYTLTCSGGGGTVSQSTSLTVQAPSPAPTVTLTATPTNLISGQSSVLTWSSTDTTSCTKSGSWTGTAATSGSATVTPAVTSTYTLACAGDGGAAIQTVTLNVVLATAPQVALQAIPTSITSTQTATLVWSSSNATTCSASDGWSGTKSTSGSETVIPSATTTYTLTCTGTGGSVSQSVMVTVQAPPPPTPEPTVTFSASPASLVAGSSSTLAWSTANATTCTASDGWSGTKATAGASVVTPATTTTYTLTCTGTGGSTSKSVTVTVTTPAPVLTFTASASPILTGNSSTLTWSATNATSCLASDGWAGNKPSSGSLSVSPNATTTYTLTCTGLGGSATGSVTITVSAIPPPTNGVLLDAPVTFTRTIPVAYPVVSGFPLAKGLTSDASIVSVVDSAGVEIPSNVTVTSRWPDNSLKAVLISAIATPGQTGWTVRVGTTRTVGTAIAAPALPGQPSLTTLADVPVTMGATTQTVVESGPVRTVARYVATLGSTMQLRAWVTAYVGLPFVTVDATVVGTATDTNSNSYPSTPVVQFKSYDWTFTQPMSGTYTIGGQTTNYSGTIAATDATLYQKGDTLFFNGFPANPPSTVSYSGVGSASRAPGWINTPSLSVAMRFFWQQFPKALRVNTSGLTLSLHPSEYLTEPYVSGATGTRPRSFYFKRSGGAKTYQFLVATGIEASQYTDLLQKPPRALPTTTYVQSTRVFGDLKASGSYSAGFDSFLFTGVYDRSVNTTTSSTAYPLSWRDFGDRLRGGNENATVYNDTHVGAVQYMLQYLRSRDERWYHFAEIATRHFMDLDVCHVTRSPSNFSGFSSDPPGHILAIKHDNFDHEERNLHFGHAHLAALPDYVLLTGDFRAKEVLIEAADWWVTMAPSLWTVPVSGAYSDTNRHVAEAERDYAWPLWVMSEAYRATGDVRYHQAAVILVKHLVAWWKWPTDHRQNRVVVGRNDWTAGTGFWTMYPYADNTSPKAGTNAPLTDVWWNGTNPWMAGALISATIRAYENDADHDLLDQPTVKTMILQTLNYVTKWGYVQPNKGYWIYAEGATNNGGENHLAHPMAWAAREFAAGVTNPEHYDHAAIWRTRANAIQADWAVIRDRGSTSTGFYGYETIWPPDFWQIESELN